MKRRILVVEDCKIHRDALCKILENLQENIEIFCASDDSEAYTIAMRQHIHLFLIDIILYPGKTGDASGLRFVQEIRGVKKYRFTPVIFITSLEDPRLYSYSQLHCFSYVEKPFQEEHIRKTVTEALTFPIREDEERYVYFRKDGIVYSQYIKDILYIENRQRKLVIHSMKNELTIPYKTCEEIMCELDSEAFVRCSRYTIINQQYIEQIDFPNRYIKLRHVKQPIEIGIMMKNRLKRVLGAFNDD